jgi:AAHS family 3-hydroxyphenylpropionic acid transporter
VRGAGVGAAVAVGRIGSLVGPLIGGALLGAGGTPAQVLGLMLPMLAVGAAATLGLSVACARSAAGAATERESGPEVRGPG